MPRETNRRASCDGRPAHRRHPASGPPRETSAHATPCRKTPHARRKTRTPRPGGQGVHSEPFGAPVSRAPLEPPCRRRAAPQRARAKQASNSRVGVQLFWRSRCPFGALGMGFLLARREWDACRIRRRVHPSMMGPAVGHACGSATYPRAGPAARRDRGHCRAQTCWTRRTAPRHPGNPSRTARPGAEGRVHRQASQ